MKTFASTQLKLGLLGGVAALATLLPLAAPAAEGKAVEVFAEQVDLDLATKTTQFRRNVRVLFDRYKATCAQATVYLDPKTQRLQRIVMTGSVVVEREGAVLRGQKVTLDVPNNRLQVEGQVYTRIPATAVPEVKAEFR